MTRRLEAGPLLVTLGALLLLVSLFLSWFSAEISAWEAFETWDVVLFTLALVSIAGGLGLTTQDVDVVDRRFLPAAVAFVVAIVASQIIDPPPAGRSSGTTGTLSVVGSAGPRASTAATRWRRDSRPSTMTAMRTRPKVSTAPAHMTSALPNASHAPVSGSWPAAAGGGSRICEATITIAAAAAAGRRRRSTTSTSCVVTPAPAAIAPSASTNSTRSHTSKASHAVIPGVNQSRNRLTSRSRAPSVTSSGPASSLRVMRPPLSWRRHMTARRSAPGEPPGPSRVQATGSAARWRSTTRAQRRPSAIAFTISDWPMRASPAANTPGRELA